MSRTIDDGSVQSHGKKRKHKDQLSNGSGEQASEKPLKKQKRDRKHSSDDGIKLKGDLESNNEQEPPPERQQNNDAGELKEIKEGKTHDDSSDDQKLSKAERKALRKEAKRLKKLKREEKAAKNSLGAPASAELVPVEKKDAQSSSYSELTSLTLLPEAGIKEFLETHSITLSDPRSQNLRPIIDFEQLPAKQKNETAMFAGFKTPTPIQAAAWPFLLAGRDAIGIAETGSGKTLAFGLPCVRYVSSLSSKQKRKGGAKAVIVSPTRELAMQIHEQLQRLVSGTNISVTCIYGGVSKDGQRESLTRSNIIVATPGRLNDFIQEGSADLSGVGYVVLDEADRMLDKGFEEEVRKIIGQTPAPECQTLMFTATWPTSIRDLAASFMRDPVKISIGEPTSDLRANSRVTQKVEVVDPKGKEYRLLQLLKEHQSGSKKNDRILVFCLYKKEATRVENFIRSKGFRVAGIHGDMNQSARTASLEAFKSGKVPLLVATDVAARGLDIPAVKLVLNVTFPLTAEDYVHRIGRTGRAGQNGLAITLFTEHDKAQSGALINVLKAAKQEVPDDLMKFGTTVKKKTHEQYGAFYREPTEGAKKATKITFD